MPGRSGLNNAAYACCEKSYMHKVVDTSVLKSPQLREFLSEPSNHAVITDYAMIEALQGESPDSYYEVMEILAERPKQVVILKSNAAVCALKTRRRSRGLQRRLTSRSQTSGFEAWCRKLEEGKRGDQAVQSQILEMRQEAADHLKSMLKDMETYGENLKKHEENYTDAELKILRKGEPYTPELHTKLVDNIFDLALSFFEQMSIEPPPSAKLYNSFIFRFAICAHLASLSWIANGGSGETKPEKLRNDAIDANFSAYATYFDGILTGDVKAAALHQNARLLLKHFTLRHEDDGASGGAGRALRATLAEPLTA